MVWRLGRRPLFISFTAVAFSPSGNELLSYPVFSNDVITTNNHDFESSFQMAVPGRVRISSWQCALLPTMMNIMALRRYLIHP
jgi:hypothetical protein